MQKILLSLILLFISFNILKGQDFAGGSGTADDPYLISTPQHLDNVRKYGEWEHRDKHFRLISDIDLGVPPWNEGEGWVPIGIFCSKFHGSGYKIKNLYINRPDSEHQGFFAFVRDIWIDSLGIENCDITGGRATGALVSRTIQYEVSDSIERRISHCWVSGKVKGTLYVGGLIGEDWMDVRYHSIIKNCYSTADVTASKNGTHGMAGYVGGLMGYCNERTALIECYSTGKIICMGTGEHDGNVGGLVGIMGGTMIRCYSSCEVRGTRLVGGKL